MRERKILVRRVIGRAYGCLPRIAYLGAGRSWSPSAARGTIGEEEYSRLNTMYTHGRAKIEGRRFRSLIFSATLGILVVWPLMVGAGTIEEAPDVTKILGNVLNFLLSVAGIVGIIGIVISGFFYLTAAGDEEQIRKAKLGLTWSVIGLTVVLGALLLVSQIGKFFASNKY